ncbi:hypothetical protein [Croceibacterium soli]|uniref:hypothetical protein n=1 Tax=Croceibacterium soli TaxID=1739690 RepID=UPI001372265E|nr:hypothetical protein [Croceibacterium soli]
MNSARTAHPPPPCLDLPGISGGLRQQPMSESKNQTNSSNQTISPREMQIGNTWVIVIAETLDFKGFRVNLATAGPPVARVWTRLGLHCRRI